MRVHSATEVGGHADRAGIPKPLAGDRSRGPPRPAEKYAAVRNSGLTSQVAEIEHQTGRLIYQRARRGDVAFGRRDAPTGKDRAVLESNGCTAEDEVVAATDQAASKQCPAFGAVQRILMPGDSAVADKRPVCFR